MTVAELNAVLSLDSSKFDTGLQGALRSVSQVSRQFAKIGREAQQVVSAVGGIFAEASKFDPQVAAVMKEVSNAQSTLAVTAARALLPAMQSVANVLTNVVKAWQSLSPELRSTISHVATVAVGIAGLVAVGGKIAGLIGPLAAIGATLLPALPIILAVVAGIAAIVLTITALHAAYRTNFGGFRDFVENMKQGFVQLGTAVKDAFKFIVETVVNSVAAMLQLIAKALNLVGKGEMAQSLLSTAARIKSSLADAFANPGSLLQAAAAAGGKAKDAFVGELKLMAGELGLDKLMSKVGGLFTGGGGALPQLESIKEANKYAEKLAKMMEEVLASDRRRSAGDESPTTKATRESMASPTASFNMPTMHNGQTGMFEPAGSSLSGQSIAGIGVATRDAKAVAYETKKLEEMRAAAVSLADSVVATFKFAGQQIMSKLGTLGTIIGDAIKGAQSGGVFGAIIAVIIDLVSESAGFASVLATAEGSVKMAIRALNPFIAAINKVSQTILGAASDMVGALIDDLMPILMAVAEAFKVIAPILEIIGVLLKILAPIFQILGSVLSVVISWLTMLVQGIFAVLRGVGFVVLLVVRGVAAVWNAILGALEKVFRTLGGLDILGAKPLAFLNDWADSIAKAKISTQGLDDAFNALDKMTWDNATAAADASANQAKAANQAASALQRLSEELTNVPQGFKVAVSRYNSTDGMGGGSGSAQGNDVGMTTINIAGSVVSLDGLVKSLREAMEKEGWQRNGWSWGGA